MYLRSDTQTPKEGGENKSPCAGFVSLLFRGIIHSVSVGKTEDQFLPEIPHDDKFDIPQLTLAQTVVSYPFANGIWKEMESKDNLMNN